MSSANAYQRIIARLFRQKRIASETTIPFERVELIAVAKALKVNLPKNLGDVIYSMRYRSGMPKEVAVTAPLGQEWIIRPAGRSKYAFALVAISHIEPNPNLLAVKILDATPGMVARYCLDDEQALLARLRYNRLIDTFAGVTCHSLQSHLRTTVPEMGQVETDEVYVGVDKRGAHYVFPVQAKGGTDRLGIVQIEQDFALCRKRFPGLLCRPIAAQFLGADVIALFEFAQTPEGIRIAAERHYRLVPADQLTSEEIVQYQRLPQD
jgi:hypothetical protein